MKKQITLSIATLFVFGLLNAQSINPANRAKNALKLTKTAKTTSNTNMEMMGQQMAMRNDNAITSSYDITAITAQGGTAEIKIIAMKVEGEAMGQEMSYDSQNPDDGNAEIGESVKETMKTITKIKFDANGIITELKGSEKMEAMAKQNAGTGGLEKGNLLDVFLKLDKTIKPGDTWKDVIDTKEVKMTNDYTYKSFENGMATIELISALKLDQTMDQMGMTVYSKQEGKVVSTLTIDVNTLIIKKKTTTTVLNGTVDVSGKTSPVSVFSTSTETVD